MRESLEKHNQFIRKLLDKPNKAEALSWLEESTDESFRTVGELDSNERSYDLIDEVYKAGAVEVWAVEIDTYPDGHQNTGKLVVLLPSEPKARRRVFGWCGSRAKALGFDPDEDVGQDHLFVMLN
ncbi:MAG: hypothetical protein M3362_01975 [Acidobacteriota bacterium]|nr:hypothetical protein [Acidobacteriota bacterium]